MATSLKTLLPEVARILGESANVLDQRQRALVREGLLESLPGHGPGSGVRASPESMAVLVIGMVATPIWSETGPAARALADAVPPTFLGGLNSRSNKPSFKEELTKIFADESLAAHVEKIEFDSSAGRVIVVPDLSHDGHLFVGGPAKSGGLQRDAQDHRRRGAGTC